jgi:hypothetical protein
LKILPISIVQHFQSLNWILQATPKDTWSKALSKFPGTPENAARSPQTLTNEIAKQNPEPVTRSRSWQEMLLDLVQTFIKLAKKEKIAKRQRFVPFLSRYFFHVL